MGSGVGPDQSITARSGVGPVLNVIPIDDGIGLSSERAERAGSEGRLGLRSIRGRAAEIGADVAVAAGPNGGTAVTISWRRR